MMIESYNDNDRVSKINIIVQATLEFAFIEKKILRQFMENFKIQYPSTTYSCFENIKLSNWSIY